MTYVITQNCCKDATCVSACPVNCIAPVPGTARFDAEPDALHRPGGLHRLRRLRRRVPGRRRRPGGRRSARPSGSTPTSTPTTTSGRAAGGGDARRRTGPLFHAWGRAELRLVAAQRLHRPRRRRRRHRAGRAVRGRAAPAAHRLDGHADRPAARGRGPRSATASRPTTPSTKRIGADPRPALRPSPGAHAARRRRRHRRDRSSSWRRTSTRSSTPSGPPPAGGSRCPARTCRACTPARSSSAGTTPTPTSPPTTCG